MNLFPTPDETIVGLSAQIQSGKLSCTELLDRCLQRIDESESLIHAWVLIDLDSAQRRATELDEELAAGNYRGPLHGIPVGIKDIIDVAGLPTAAGSSGWKNKIAAEDATLTRRLREAGAVILGKTVTTQYASFDPPITRNPWNIERTPGGSSSGSAAAVATGMCVAAIGSQTGGSITRPASYCGVAGCKPSYGRVSVRGVLPLAPSLDHPGPIARCVEDLAILYDIIAGYDPSDPYSIDVPNESTSSTDVGNSLIVPKLGRLEGMFVELADQDVQQGFQNAVEHWQSADAEIKLAPLPIEFDNVLKPHRLIMATETAAVHQKRFAEQPAEYDPCITLLIDEGLQTSAIDYVLARQHQLLLKRRIVESFAGFDALLCPATTEAAPDISTTGNPAFNSPWSYCGLPTVSIPVGLSAEGMPLAVQLIGPPNGETHLFNIARWCERVVWSTPG